MASFIFDLGGKKVRANVEEVKGPSGSRFKASAKCPFCSKLTTVGNNPGNNKTKAKAEGDLKSSMIRHYEGQHKK